MTTKGLHVNARLVLKASFRDENDKYVKTVKCVVDGGSPLIEQRTDLRAL